LKEKYARKAQYYNIQLTKADKGANAASLSFERINHEAKAYAGVYCLRTRAGDTLHIRKAARPEPWQQTIYKALGLSYNPGGDVKTIIADRE